MCIGPNKTILKLWPGTHKWPGNKKKSARQEREERTLTKPIILNLKLGDIVLFRVDLIHCGGEYEAGKFIRVHSYVDVGGNSHTSGSLVGVDTEEYKYLVGARPINDRKESKWWSSGSESE